ncbi:MAG: Mur ligase [Xanthomonadales bacterium]|nr:Mur ligase [Gammaproteobacteria bacterium]MBT8053542.1 Mur ligase [Gammaproteobacteria bacterium]NND57977.1 Mur ligase [Xanthomonadales bacterium]NNK50857.1 Mur ligase [Xanthomonadales bacterium]
MTDSRRLTGPNLYWDRPSAIIDVEIEGSPEPVIQAWEAAVKQWLDQAGYPDEKTCFRVFEGGASLLISAPIDVLYSMCELNELAWASALSACSSGPKPDPDEEVPRLTRLFDEERNPSLLNLQAAAHEHRVPFLWDDDEVSLGYGKTCRSWKPDELPAPCGLNWSGFGTVPLALVTGTNGKSTTVRMTAAIMTAAGFGAGLTSTDFIRVGNRLIDSGDYSGTGGARMLMRQPDVEMAVLEVARGGLLRRGLGVECADVAVVTNVAADHLGEYGIHSVQDLIPVKFIVRRALSANAPLVLNADDEGVAAYADTLENAVVWFSLDPGNTRLQKSVAGGQTAAWLERDWLMLAGQGDPRRVARIAEIPATMSGIVRHNVRNALAAMCVASVLDIGDDAIREGLAAFKGDEHDNPGRGNWFEHRLDGGIVRILVDFAHNQHGMEALAETINQVPSERVILLIGQAGDRLDEDIAALVRAACSVRPDQLLVADLPGYERGRKPFEVAELIRSEAIRNGVPAEGTRIFPSPQEATAEALRSAQPGDLLVLLALTQRAEALALVHDYISRGASRHG